MVVRASHQIKCEARTGLLYSALTSTFTVSRVELATLADLKSTLSDA